MHQLDQGVDSGACIHSGCDNNGGVDSIAILVSGGYAVGVVGGFMSHELARAVCVSLVVATIVLS